MYPGARAVVIPARTEATGEHTTRRVVVAADRRSFTLDDGQVYERLSGALWSQRRSPAAVRGDGSAAERQRPSNRAAPSVQA